MYKSKSLPKCIFGFTVLELLVVIAIIGILVAIVIAATSASRDKGNSAAVRQNLTNTRPQAGLYYNEAGYVFWISAADNACVNDKNSTPKGIADMLLAADLANGTGVVDCNVSISGWAVAAQLVGADSNKYYCTDSAGFGADIVGVIGGSGVGDFGVNALVCN